MTSTPRQDGRDDLEGDDLRTFEEKMRSLFSRLPPSNGPGLSSAGDAADRTNDANLNLSA